MLCGASAAAAAALLTGAPNLIRAGSLGAGDIKLAGVLGGLLGLLNALIVVAAGVVGALVALVLCRATGNAGRVATGLPFAASGSTMT